MTQNIDEINAEWAADSADFNDNFDANKHSRETYKLHQKYYNWYTQHVIRKLRLVSELKRLENDKVDYYNGEMELAKIKEYGWPLQPKKMLKSDITRVIGSDAEIVKLTLLIGIHDATIKYIEDILKTITYRHTVIKNILDFERFKSGG